MHVIRRTILLIKIDLISSRTGLLPEMANPMLLWFVGYSNITSIAIVTFCFLAMTLFIGLISMNGDYQGRSNVRLGVEQRNMVKVSNPFFLHLEERSKKLTDGLHVRLSSLLASNVCVLWGVKINPFHDLILKPGTWIQKMFLYNRLDESGDLDALHCDRLQFSGAGEHFITLRCPDRVSSETLGDMPRKRYPAAVFIFLPESSASAVGCCRSEETRDMVSDELQRESHPQSENEGQNSIIGLISIIHLQDERVTQSSHIISQYVKTSGVPLYSLQPLYLSGGDFQSDLEHREDKPTQSHKKDKPTQSQRQDKPTQSQREDKPSQSHREDKPSQSQREDEPSHREDKPSQSQREDKPSQSQREDKPSQREDKPSQSQREDKPTQSNRNGRPESLAVILQASGSKAPVSHACTSNLHSSTHASEWNRKDVNRHEDSSFGGGATTVRDKITSVSSRASVPGTKSGCTRDTDDTYMTEKLQRESRYRDGEADTRIEPICDIANVCDDDDDDDEGSVSRDRVEAECVVCQTHRVKCALLPCRHACVCSGCLKLLFRCPLCRAGIESYFILQSHRSSIDDSTDDGDGEGDEERVLQNLQHQAVNASFAQMWHRLHARLNEMFGFR